jgi:N6-adenosine-specific RNA methylase IME4
MSKALSRGAFDESPITLGGVVLRHHLAVIDPLAEDTDINDAILFAEAAWESAPYWIGDLVVACEDRAARRRRVTQISDITGLAPHTIDNLARISRKVALPERNLAPDVSYADVVAKMPPREQRLWLTKAREEGWKIREFRLEVKAAEKRGALTEPGHIEGRHRVWLIDFPWTYQASQPSTSNAQRHYPGMTLAEGLALADQIKAHSTHEAVSFWWVTAPMLYYATEPEHGPDPYRLIRAAGFTPKTGAVWDKVKHVFGNYVSVRHEHVIIATRGDGMTPDRPTPMPDSVITERASDVHSEKPAAVAQMIERLYDGPYVELFARQPREGWTTWGNQITSLPTSGRPERSRE